MNTVSVVAGKRKLKYFEVDTRRNGINQTKTELLLFCDVLKCIADNLEFLLLSLVFSFKLVFPQIHSHLNKAIYFLYYIYSTDTTTRYKNSLWYFRYACVKSTSVGYPRKCTDIL